MCVCRQRPWALRRDLEHQKLLRVRNLQTWRPWRKAKIPCSQSLRRRTQKARDAPDGWMVDDESPVDRARAHHVFYVRASAFHMDARTRKQAYPSLCCAIFTRVFEMVPKWRIPSDLVDFSSLTRFLSLREKRLSILVVTSISLPRWKSFVQI
jgi:hypothetical protein